MLVGKEFTWRSAAVSPPAEMRAGKFKCLLFWPKAQELSIANARYFRFQDADHWGHSYRLTFEEQGAQVLAWAPVEQVFHKTEAA